MITPEALADLKALWLKASKPPMVLAPLGTSRQLVQISTLKPGALEVAKFTQDPAEPEKVAVCSAMDNAKFILACFAQVPELIAEIERLYEAERARVESPREPRPAGADRAKDRARA